MTFHKERVINGINVYNALLNIQIVNLSFIAHNSAKLEQYLIKMSRLVFEIGSFFIYI